MVRFQKLWSFGECRVLFWLSFIFTNPSAQAGYDTRSIFKAKFNRFKFIIFPSPRLVASPSLPYYLPIAGRRIIGFIPFPRVLMLCEMQSVSARIWTRVTVSISYDDNHYTTSTSIYCHCSQVDPGLEWLYLIRYCIWLNRIKQCIYARLNCLK